MPRTVGRDDRRSEGARLRRLRDLLGLSQRELGLAETGKPVVHALHTGRIARGGGAIFALISIMLRALVARRADTPLARSLRRKLLSRYVYELGRLKGLPMKIAQVFSPISFALSDEDRRELEQLQSVGDPIPAIVIARIFREAFGEPPAKLFGEWSAAPFAMASIGQVHKAKLASGEAVAVKVQYPRIVDALKSDLAHLTVLDSLASALAPAQSKGVIASTWRETFLAECDYRQEAQNQATFAQLFLHRRDMSIPRVHAALSNQRILTQELIDGVRFETFCKTASQSTRDRAAATIFDFVFEALFVHGLFYADIHADNFLFTTTGVAFVDFGRVQRFSAPVLAAYRALSRAMLDERPRPEIDACFLATVSVPDPARFDFEHNHRILASFYEPCLDDRPYRYTRAHLEEMWQLFTKNNPNYGRINWNAESLFLHQLQFGLFELFCRLDPRISVRQKLKAVFAKIP